MELELTIDRFEGDKVVLIFNGEKIIWPKAKMPDNIYEGMILKFTIETQEENEKRKRKQASDILNEILNPQSED